MALFDKLSKDSLLEKAKQVGNKATTITQKAANSVTATYNQTQEKLEQNKEKRRQAKLPQEGGIKRYEVNYRGGLPGYPKEKNVSRHPTIYLDVMPDRFSFHPKPKSQAWFAGVDIPYNRVISLEITERTVNTAETLISVGRENLTFAQKNMLELTYQERKRVHNLKYYTWVEQQGKTSEELQSLWYDTEHTWDSVKADADRVDELIRQFNEDTGLLKKL